MQNCSTYKMKSVGIKDNTLLVKCLLLYKAKLKSANEARNMTKKYFDDMIYLWTEDTGAGLF